MAYASLKDVAARAGVSFQTASKVLNGQPGAASEETGKRVLAAARELGYVRNALARGLKQQRSMTIGVLSDDFADAAVTHFVSAAQRALDGEGGVALVASASPGSDPLVPLRRLEEHRVQGLLIVAPSLEHDPRLAEALPPTLPVVSLAHVAGASVPLVGSDHRQTGALVAEHLLRLGHRRIGTVTGVSARRVTAHRHAGFENALAAAGVPLDPEAVVEADWSVAGGRAAAHRLLDRVPDLTAVFAHTDLMALGVLRALSERNVPVPELCSVVGCDDLETAAYFDPPLSTVHVPFEETGVLATRLLLRAVRGEQIPRRELLPVSFVERASTARPPPAAGRADPGSPQQTAARQQTLAPSQGGRS